MTKEINRVKKTKIAISDFSVVIKDAYTVVMTRKIIYCSRGVEKILKAMTNDCVKATSQEKHSEWVVGTEVLYG